MSRVESRFTKTLTSKEHLLSCLLSLQTIENLTDAIQLVTVVHITALYRVFIIFNAICKYFSSRSVLIWSTHETKLVVPKQRSVESRPLWQTRIHNALASNFFGNLPGSQKDFFVFSYVWINLPVLWSFKKTQSQNNKKTPPSNPASFVKLFSDYLLLSYLSSTEIFTWTSRTLIKY